MAALVASPARLSHPTTFEPREVTTTTTMPALTNGAPSLGSGPSLLELPTSTPPALLVANGSKVPLLSPLQAKDVQPPSSLLATSRKLDFDVLPYDDKVHGQYTITSPCIIAILHHPSFLRLKSVLQHGITALVRLTDGEPVTRYEHSVGAMIAVAKAGGSEEAMIAALLHDVAHTALSHVADQVFGYVVHEDDKDSFLDPSGLKQILVAHGFDSARILHEENFPLLELDTPRVCGDRFDYGLRDSVAFGKLALADARAISDAIVPFQRPDEPGPTMAIRQKDQHLALKLARAYLESDKYAWANPKHAWLYHLAAEAIKHAMHKEKSLFKADLWWPNARKPSLAEQQQGGDAAFWALLQEKGSDETRRRAARVHCDYELRPLPASSFLDDDDDEMEEALEEWEEPFVVTIKCRTLDPDVIVSDPRLGRDVVKPLSELDAGWRLEREAHLNEVGGTKRFVVVDLRKKHEVLARRAV